MSSKGGVDIIIPVYNVEPYLRRCLDSVLRQTYKHWRAICIDDGSTDGSLAVLNEYAAKDSRFMVVHQENEGVAHARNQGLALADAEYVMFIDSDDFIHPQILSLLVHLIERDGTDMVSCYKDVFYRNIQLKLLRYLKRDTINARPWRMYFRYHPRLVRSVVTDDVLKYISDWNHPKQKFALKHCYVWRNLFRRSLVKDVKFLKMKYEDIPWWSELFVKPVKGTITHLPLYYYYVNRGSISKTTDVLMTLSLLLDGLYYAHKLYAAAGDKERMALWSHNLKWAILVRGANDLNKIDGRPHSDILKKNIARLSKTEFFNDAETPLEISAKETFFAVAEQYEA